MDVDAKWPDLDSRESKTTKQPPRNIRNIRINLPLRIMAVGELWACFLERVDGVLKGREATCPA